MGEDSDSEVEMGEESTLHIYPVNDLIAHEMSEDCVCGPITKPKERDDGSISWLLIHPALDGRKWKA